jgi:hypothetical protein
MSLFHYTDLNAVVSILRKPALRCTDLRYLNDKTEFRHGIERLLETLPEAPYGLFHNEARVDQSRAHVEEALLRANTEYTQFNEFFVMSLSRSGDLLSQWRGYGSYAIEFHDEELSRQVPSLRQCLYSREEQDRAALSELTDAITAVSHDFQPNGLVGLKGTNAVSKLYGVAATFKDDGFAEEREARLIITDVAPEAVNYRPRAQMLIPYVEIPITLDCIKAIHLGPMPWQDAAFMAMQGFCAQIENAWQVESANVEYWLQVNRSKIPFRAA